MATWGRLGGSLEASWSMLEAVLSKLKTSWAILEVILGSQRPSWGNLGQSWTLQSVATPPVQVQGSWQGGGVNPSPNWEEGGMEEETR